MSQHLNRDGHDVFKTNGARNPQDKIEAEAKDVAQSVKHAAAQTARDVRSTAERDLETVKSEASRQIAYARNAATNLVDEQKNFAAQQVRGIGSAFNAAAGEMRNAGQDQFAHYASDVGATLDRFSEKIEGASVGELAGTVERFARRNPLAFVGAVALAGVAVSRFLRASKPNGVEDTNKYYAPSARTGYRKDGGFNG